MKCNVGMQRRTRNRCCHRAAVTSAEKTAVNSFSCLKYEIKYNNIINAMTRSLLLFLLNIFIFQENALKGNGVHEAAAILG